MTNMVKKLADTLQGSGRLRFAIQFEAIPFKDFVELDGRPAFHPAEVHGDRTVERQAQGVVAIAPVFNEGDVGMGDGGKFGLHAVLSALNYSVDTQMVARVGFIVVRKGGAYMLPSTNSLL